MSRGPGRIECGIAAIPTDYRVSEPLNSESEWAAAIRSCCPALVRRFIKRVD
jgi:hypothetical protein